MRTEVNPEDRNDLETAIMALETNKEIVERMVSLYAQLYGHAFDKLMEAGFSAQDALEIVKARGYLCEDAR